jgi:hypothetical protein
VYKKYYKHVRNARSATTARSIHIDAIIKEENTTSVNMTKNHRIDRERGYVRERASTREKRASAREKRASTREKRASAREREREREHPIERERIRQQTTG